MDAAATVNAINQAIYADMAAFLEATWQSNSEKDQIKRGQNS